jgi:hypothetical protein
MLVQQSAQLLANAQKQHLALLQHAPAPGPPPLPPAPPAFPLPVLPPLPPVQNPPASPPVRRGPSVPAGQGKSAEVVQALMEEAKKAKGTKKKRK